jgi:hypothetical protein
LPTGAELEGGGRRGRGRWRCCQEALRGAGRCRSQRLGERHPARLGVQYKTIVDTDENGKPSPPGCAGGAVERPVPEAVRHLLRGVQLPRLRARIGLRVQPPGGGEDQGAVARTCSTQIVEMQGQRVAFGRFSEEMNGRVCPGPQRGSGRIRPTVQVGEGGQGNSRTTASSSGSPPRGRAPEGCLAPCSATGRLPSGPFQRWRRPRYDKPDHRRDRARLIANSA